MKTIGIIGGMGPLASAHLYRKIVLKTEAELDQEHIHIIIDSNTGIPDRTRSILGTGESPLEELVKSARMLECAGADFLIMCCNTAHYYHQSIADEVGIPFLNMLEETVRFIERKYGKDAVVGLLATDGSLRTGIFDEYFRQAGIRVVKPVKKQKYVMDYVYDGLKKNRFEDGRGRFMEAVAELRESGAQVFILGCTELSIANDMFGLGEEFIDPVDVLAERAIEFAGGKVRRP
jgi:aspartate racemase